MQRGGRDNELISFLEFCNFTSNLQVDLNFRDDVLAVARGDALQNDVGQVDLNFRDDVLAVAQGDPLQNDVGQIDLNFPDDVFFDFAQSDPLQNDNRNLIQNPNPFLLNPYPNQNQEQGLFAPFEGMHIHPNFNNLMELQYQPYYQLNPELHMPSNQNYMARPPCPHTNATNVASISRGEIDISRSSCRRRDRTIMNRPTYNGTGNSASEPMQQNIEGFVRITRMRADPGQGRTSMVVVSPNTAQYNMVFSVPNPNPGQLIALAFNPLSIPLAGGNSIPSPNLSPMQNIPETAPAISGRVTSQSWPVALPSSDHELAQYWAMLPELAGLTNQRTTSHQQPVRAIASSDAYQIRRTRSQPYEVYQDQPYQVYQPHQAVPVSTIPSVPASSGLSVSVPDHTASTSQTGNSGVCFFFLPSEERPSYLPPIRIRFPRDTPSIVALEIQARLNREIMARNLVRDLHPYADERQHTTLLPGTMHDEWRVIDRHRDMRLDIERMSHEELLELTERIGSVSTGVSEEIVNERMQQRPFSALLENKTDPCCICQEEYVEDDKVGTLDCGHNFHRECIKKWLGQNNICPICKKPGIDT